MRKGILCLLLAVAFSANAQQKPSLKDLLYSGKLKQDSTAVIRKTDDLSTKIDTATKMPAAVENQNAALTTSEPTTTTVVMDTSNAPATNDTVNNATDVKNAVPATAVKSNAKIWKEHTDSLVAALKTEVLANKKIKKGTYYLTLEYEIGTDGAVNVLQVVSSPKNNILQQGVKDRLTYLTPQLQPAVDSNGQPRKVKRKHNFSVTKE